MTSKDFELDRKVFVVSSYLQEVNSTLSTPNIVNGGARCYTTRWIGWSPPPSRWVTLNLSFCYKSDRNLADTEVFCDITSIIGYVVFQLGWAFA